MIAEGTKKQRKQWYHNSFASLPFSKHDLHAIFPKYTRKRHRYSLAHLGGVNITDCGITSQICLGQNTNTLSHQGQ